MQKDPMTCGAFGEVFRRAKPGKGVLGGCFVSRGFRRAGNQAGEFEQRTGRGGGGAAVARSCAGNSRWCPSADEKMLNCRGVKQRRRCRNDETDTIVLRSMASASRIRRYGDDDAINHNPSVCRG